MSGSSSVGWVYFVGIIVAYSLPTIVAGARGHQSTGGIFLLNLLLGWTLLGWIIALIWSASAVTPTGRGRSDDFGHIEITDPPSDRPRADERKCPHCAETIKTAAKICRFCDRPVVAMSGGELMT